MTVHYDRVKQFMVKAGQETPDRPCELGEDVRILRVKLALEEFLELATAMGIRVIAKDDADSVFLNCDDESVFGKTKFTFDVTKYKFDLIATADALGDVSVINTGTMIACGIRDEPLLEAIDNSNLAKFEPPTCPGLPGEPCGAAMQGMFNGMFNGQDDDGWLCLRSALHPTQPKEFGPYKREDGKWIKPPYWKLPDLAKVLANQDSWTPPGGKNDNAALRRTFDAWMQAYLGDHPRQENHRFTRDEMQQAWEAGRKSPVPAKAPLLSLTLSAAFTRWMEEYLDTGAKPFVWSQKDAEEAFVMGVQLGHAKATADLVGSPYKLPEPQNPTPDNLEVRVHGDSLRSHRGWWAVMDDPGPEFTNGAKVTFLDSLSGDTVDTGEIVRVLKPGAAMYKDRGHAKLDFGDKADWWKIVYSYVLRPTDAFVPGKPAFAIDDRVICHGRNIEGKKGTIADCKYRSTAKTWMYVVELDEKPNGIHGINTYWTLEESFLTRLVEPKFVRDGLSLARSDREQSNNFLAEGGRGTGNILDNYIRRHKFQVGDSVKVNKMAGNEAGSVSGIYSINDRIYYNVRYNENCSIGYLTEDELTSAV